MQTIDNAFAQAKFDRTLLVSPVGLCYVITPVGRPIDNDPSLALNQFRHTYRAKHLLASHSNRWGYRFDLTRLYHQLCPTPLQHHKTRDDMLTELSQRIAHGELLVYKVHNFIEAPLNPTRTHSARAVPPPQTSQTNSSTQSTQSTQSTKILPRGGSVAPLEPTDTLDISCILPDGSPAAAQPYQVKLLSSGAVMNGSLNAEGVMHLEGLQPSDVEVTFGTPITNSEIEATRQKINHVLTAMIAAQQAEATKIEAEYSQLNGFQKTGHMLKSAATGFYNAGAGLLEFAANVHDVSSLSGTLNRVLKSAWQANNMVDDSWTANFGRTFNDSQHQAIVKALGFDPASIKKETLAEAYDIASFINGDPATKTALLSFAKDMVASQHEIEWANIAGSAIFEIVFTALIVVATGGAGTAGALGSKAHLTQHFSQLGTLFKTLTKQLKQKAQYTFKRGKTNQAIEHKIHRPDGADVPIEIKSNNNLSLAARRGVSPISLLDAQERLKSMARVIAENGYKPKYTDAELLAIAKSGNLAKERFHVRFMPAKYMNDHDGNIGQGKLGQVLKTQSGEGAKYWSTTFDQIEDADTNFELIAQKLGLGDWYDPNEEYALIIIDTEKAIDLTGSTTISATFENLGEFAYTELPDLFSPELMNKVMNKDFQNLYSKHYKNAVESKYLTGTDDISNFNIYLTDIGLDSNLKNLLLDRMNMHYIIGNNQDYLGTGVTLDQIPNSPNTAGVVETFIFERKSVTINQLDSIGASLILLSTPI